MDKEKLPDCVPVNLILITWNVRLSVWTTLKQSPTIRALKSDFVGQFRDRVLGSVARMNIDCFRPSVQKEKSTHNCAKSLHGLQWQWCQWYFTIFYRKINTAISTDEGGSLRGAAWALWELSIHHWMYWRLRPESVRWDWRKLTKYWQNITSRLWSLSNCPTTYLVKSLSGRESDNN